MENKLETIILLDRGLYRGYIGIMDNAMEATIFYRGVYRGYIGIMENNMETAMLYRVSIGTI